MNKIFHDEIFKNVFCLTPSQVDGVFFYKKKCFVIKLNNVYLQYNKTLNRENYEQKIKEKAGQIRVDRNTNPKKFQRLPVP